MALWFYGSVVLWFCGSMVLWFYGSAASLGDPNPNPNPDDDEDDLGFVDADQVQAEELAGGNRLALLLKALVALCFEERVGTHLPASACRVFAAARHAPAI